MKARRKGWSGGRSGRLTRAFDHTPVAATIFPVSAAKFAHILPAAEEDGEYNRLLLCILKIVDLRHVPLECGILCTDWAASVVSLARKGPPLFCFPPTYRKNMTRGGYRNPEGNNQFDNGTGDLICVDLVQASFDLHMTPIFSTTGWHSSRQPQEVL